MHKSAKKLLAILDGKPTGTKGQSMVELSLTMPIFLIMLMGLVEVGYFANNYLILSDVVRAAGRYGSLQDPLDWRPGNERLYHFLDCDATSINPNAATEYPIPAGPNLNLSQVQSEVNSALQLGGYFRTDGTESANLGYYDGVACSVLANLAPLELNRTVDDIVISVFSYATLEGAEPCGGAANSPCIRVTGRYPARQNECANDARDPFDIDGDGVLDDGSGETPAERRDINGDYFDSTTDEQVRGYVFRGHAFDPDEPSCFGSHFTVQWMEEQLEKSLVLPNNDGERMDVDEITAIPNYGLVLVEITFASEQLLGLPFFTWVGNPIDVHIWGIFPVSAAEPDIEVN